MKNISIAILSIFLFVGIACNQEQAKSSTTTSTAPQPKATPVVTKNTPSSPPSHANSPIKWMSFEEAQEAMKKEPRKLFVDVYTYWCGPCKMLDRNTFANPKFAKYVNDNYYAVKFNAQDENDIVFAGNTYSNPNYDPKRGQRRRNATHQLAGAFQVRAFPTMVILNEQLQIMKSIRGYKTPQQLQPILQQFAQI